MKLLEEEDKNCAIDEETLEIKENYGKAMTEEERMNSNNASAAQGEESREVGGRWEEGGGKRGGDIDVCIEDGKTMPKIPTRSDFNQRWV